MTVRVSRRRIDMNGVQLRLSKGADVASASALTLGNDGNYFDITGTTTITSIGALTTGTVVRLHFDGALTLTHHATNLILPSSANITTSAGDEATFTEYTTGNWRCTNYTKASGEAVVSAAGGGGKVVQVKYATRTTSFSTTTTMPSSTVPQITEGGEIITVSITPEDTANILVLLFNTYIDGGAQSSEVAVALFVGTTADALAATGARTGNAGQRKVFSLQHVMVAGSTSELTFRVRIGCATAGTLNANHSFNPTPGTSLVITEYRP